MDKQAPIYVVVARSDIAIRHRQPGDDARDPVVFETNVNGSTHEAARARAAQAERDGYGPCRIARLVFEDDPGFAP